MIYSLPPSLSSSLSPSFLPRFIGFCALWAYKRSRVTQLILVGDPIQISMELKNDRDSHPPTQLSIQQTTLSIQ